MPPERTEEYDVPSGDELSGAEAALLVAFPTPRVLPIPSTSEPIGRSWFEDQGVADPKISSAHLAFARSAGSVSVTDPGSRNGTWIDGQRLAARERAKLADGSLIRLGRTILVYRDELPGARDADQPIGSLVGPFGLRSVAAAVDAIRRRPPRCVLIEGETGTGKELVAAAVAHALRPGCPYAALNVAGIPAGVFESQLFGHVSGAFSGSGRGSRGVVAAHDGGVIFLDEIGELPLELQPKLLRFLENGEILPVGGDRAMRADVVVVAATNRSLERMVELGAFRRDLYARLAIASVEIPPLRERVEDIFAIACEIAARKGERFDLAQVDVEAVERLLLHTWANNVRELHAILERIAANTPPPSLRMTTVKQVLGAAPLRQTGALTLDRVNAALAACAGNQSRAARDLGVTRGQLLRFIKAHGGNASS
jgi:transcriptional regulator of acetoin/glycerol metabolism